MQVSVIILNYNVRYFLEQCVLSVQNALQGIDGEIIVIDNDSSDESCKMMKERFPSIQLIENKENLGFPKGNNIGVEKAKGNYICILNPDTVVAEDTFSKVLAFAQTQKNLGIIGCKLIDGTGNFLPESKRGIPTPWVAFTKIFGLYKFFPKSKLFNQYYAQHVSENETGEVAILVGAFMVMKRELYNDIGGFDEKCFMYSDDIDLSYMALKKGKANFYFPETTIIHYKGESTIKDETYMKRFREAMQFFYKKHFKVSLLFEVFMKIGAFFFSLFKKSQAVTLTNTIDDFILLSDNENVRIKVENLLGKKVQRYKYTSKNTINSLISDTGRNTEIIFDINCITFKNVIESMVELKSKHLTFKNLPPGSNFIIGSNSSNNRGEVLKMED